MEGLYLTNISELFSLMLLTVSLINMTSGGVTIFGLPNSIDIYVDSDVMNQPYLIFGSGNRNSKIIIEPNYLSQIPNIKLVENITK